MSKLITVIVILFSLCSVVRVFATLAYNGSGDPEAAGFVFYSEIPGDTDPSNPLAWDFDAEGGSPQPGILYQNSTSFSGIGVSSSHYSLGGTLAAAEFVNANGWTLEFRTQSLQNTGDRFGNFLVVSDDVGGIGILLNPDNYEFYDREFTGYPSTSDLQVTGLSVDYHTTLLKVAPGGTSVEVSIDGILQGTVPFGGVSPTPHLRFGDGSSGSAGESNWDYIHVNVPEPSAFLCVGLVGLVSAARRRRKSVESQSEAAAYRIAGLGF